MAEQPDGWEARGKPLTLFRRYAFERYSQTRDFLDALAALTQETGIHPQNINFGTTYVNITLQPAGDEGFTEAERAFALRVNDLSQQNEA